MSTKEQIVKVQPRNGDRDKACVKCLKSDIPAVEAKSKSRPTLKEFHFNLGNSTEGAIGMSAVVQSCNEETALDILKAALPAELSVHTEDDDVIYVDVHINPENITVRDIDEVLEEIC